MYCDGAGVMEQEGLSNALTKVANYKIDGNKLELRVAYGSLQASFTTQP